MGRAAKTWTTIDESDLGTVQGGRVNVNIDGGEWARACTAAGGMPNIYTGSGQLLGPYTGLVRGEGTVLRCDPKPAEQQQPQQEQQEQQQQSPSGDAQNSYNAPEGNDGGGAQGAGNDGGYGSDPGASDNSGYGADAGSDASYASNDAGGNDGGGSEEA